MTPSPDAAFNRLYDAHLKHLKLKGLQPKTIDAYASQQMAVPYQNRIPPGQVISGGWQIRATVPRDNMAIFVDSLSERQALQVLHRAQAPANWEAGPESQKIEINLVR